MVKHEVEAALAAGHLWGAMRNGRYWRLRRNGQTQVWKTRPGQYRIPVKAGLYAYAQVTHESLVAYHNEANDDWRNAHFVVTFGADPNDSIKRNVLNRIASL